MSNKKRKSIIGLTLYAAHYVKHLNINMSVKKTFLTLINIYVQIYNIFIQVSIFSSFITE